MDCGLPGFSVHGIFQARVLGSGLPFPSPGDLPNPGIEPGSPVLQAEALAPEPPGKPKNTGVGSLSLADLPNPGIEPGSPALQADSSLTEL